MIINKNTTTAEVNNTFVAAYPYLKLAFYKKSHDHFHGSQKKDEIAKETTLEVLNPDMQEGEIEWTGQMSVDALETHFEEKFGLHVQVFRKSGDIWLQTSKTDHWTLDEQNIHATQNEKFATK